MAIFMVQNDLTPENIVERGENLTFPGFCSELFQGNDGAATLGIPKRTAESGSEGRDTHHMPSG